ncbi:hypothetical protein, partial [Mobiluncus mulieris]|uniref:hypothetical protein n=1 Tax=Mobiluncus mulieris TaxID=2052 RepID=UPI001B8C2060
PHNTEENTKPTKKPKSEPQSGSLLTAQPAHFYLTTHIDEQVGGKGVFTVLVTPPLHGASHVVFGQTPVVTLSCTIGVT